MTEKDAIKFLRTPRKLMVVGASNKPHRAGHYVPKFLQQLGFELIPVNPNETEIWGIPALASMDDYSGKVDSIIFYRNVKSAKQLALKAIEDRKTDFIWFPDLVTSNTVAEKAKLANIGFIQNRCPLRDYHDLVDGKEDKLLEFDLPTTELFSSSK